MQGVYLRGLAVAGLVAAGVVALPAVAGAASGSTLYVDDTNKSCTDSGSGLSTAPFCTISAAAAVVQPGQTVQVAAGMYAPVQITRSGTSTEPITFSGDTLGLGDSVTVGYQGTMVAANAFVVDGASNVVIHGFGLEGAASPVLVENSANVTIDQNVIRSGSAASGVEVSGTSSGVTVSRNFIFTGGAAGIQVDPGVQATTITTNEVESDGATGVAVDGASGTVVNSNTVTTQCGGGIILSGASTSSVVENNIVDTAVPTSPEGSCPAEPNSIEVDSSATSGTVADYNLIDPASRGPLYDWAGTAYSTISAFTAATSQGAHDVVADPRLQSIFNQNGLDIESDSPAIDSADANAPGESSTDILGNARADDPSVTNTGAGDGYHDRGAFEFEAPLTRLTVSSAHETGGGPLDVTFSASIDNPWGDSATYTVYFGDGTSTVLTTAADTFSVNHTFAAYSDILDYADVDVSDASKRPDISAQAMASVGAGYTPVSPLRILDTRHAVGISTMTPIAAGHDVVVQVGGKGGVPANASAVVVNATAVSPTGNGVLTVFADGQNLPHASSLNYGTGQTVPNLVTTRMTDGKIRIHVGGSGTVHLLVDLEGYYGDAGDAYAAVSPTRVLDTRHAIGVTGSKPLAAGGTITLSLARYLPAGVTSVAMNLTETAATGNGVLTVYPAGTSVPNASNLNYGTGQTLANAVIVPVVNGTVQIHESGTGGAHVIADLAGYYGSSATDYFVPYQPLRLADSRSGTGAVGPASAQYAEQLSEQAVTSGPGTAAVYNLTETQPTSAGYLTLYPSGTGVPTASNINFTAGTTRANMVTVPLGDISQTNILDLYDGQSTGTVQFILDLDGMFRPESYGSGTEL